MSSLAIGEDTGVANKRGPNQRRTRVSSPREPPANKKRRWTFFSSRGRAPAPAPTDDASDASPPPGPGDIVAVTIIHPVRVVGLGLDTSADEYSATSSFKRAAADDDGDEIPVGAVAFRGYSDASRAARRVLLHNGTVNGVTFGGNGNGRSSSVFAAHGVSIDHAKLHTFLARAACAHGDAKLAAVDVRGDGGGETASHTTPFAWCTPFLKDFSRRHSSSALPFQRLTGKTFD